MSELLIKAELQKLAKMLDVPVAELAFVSHLQLEQLRGLRQAVSGYLYDRHARRFKRLAESTRLLPNKVVAVICEKVIPARISAQVTGLLEPAAAVDLAGRLDTGYQADICVALDPRRAREVLQAMPADNVVKVAHELLRRREFMTMAQFVDALTNEQIRRVALEMNGESLLRVGFYVESVERLDQLIALLEAPQLAQTLAAGAEDDGALWPEILSLAERLGEAQRRRLGDRLAEASPQVLTSLVQALYERDLWRDAVVLFDALNEGAQEVLIAALVSHADSDSGPRDHLHRILPLLDDGLRRKILLALDQT